MESTTAQTPTDNKKFILIVLGVVVLLVVAIAVLLVLSTREEAKGANQTTAETMQDQPDYQEQSSSPQSTQPELMWRLGADGYEKTGAVPECEDPLLINAPVTLENVTSILYPGQTRGGNYKPHGGFRFDNNSSNAESVVAPMEGFVVEGARYIAEGEIQYTFDIIHPCGIMYRLGHLRELTPKLQAIADEFPEATADSRTTRVNPSVWVDAGEEIATKIGIISDQNTFVDFGVYDLRQKNEASRDPSYATSHDAFAQRAICWLDNLGDDSAEVRSLPAGDPTSGKNSDYCN